MARASAELSTSRALEGRLQQRLASSVPTAQLEEMAARLQVGTNRMFLTLASDACVTC
jgi:hypothetical protein